MSTIPPSSSDPVLSGAGANSSGTIFKIATVVLAITTIGFAIWGFVTYQSLNSEKAANASATSIVDGDSAEIKQAKEEIAKLSKEYNIELGDVNKDQASLVKVRAEYENAKKAAASASASAQQTLAASQAATKLAQVCAKTLATGLATIYNDVVPGVTFPEVAAAMASARVPCAGITTVGPQ